MLMGWDGGDHSKSFLIASSARGCLSDTSAQKVTIGADGLMITGMVYLWCIYHEVSSGMAPNP